MEKIALYRYVDDGMTTITPIPRDTSDTPSKYRLIADDGLELTDGVIVTESIDVWCETVDGWRETEKQISAEEALAIIVGGDVSAKE